MLINNNFFISLISRIISIAKEKGVKLGRPKVITPPTTSYLLNKYINYKKTNNETVKLIN